MRKKRVAVLLNSGQVQPRAAAVAQSRQQSNAEGGHGGAAVAAGGGSSSAMVASGGGGAGTPQTVPSGSKRKNTDLWPEPKAARIGGAGGSGGVGEDIDNRAPSAGGGGGGGFGGFQVQSGKGTGTGASQGPGGEVAMAGHDAVKSDQDGQTEYDDTESDDEIEAEVQRTDRMSSEDDGSKRRRVTGEPEVAGSEVATSVASASEVAGSEVPSGSAVTPQPKVDARRNVELSCALAGHEYSRAGNHRMALHMFNTCKVVATEMGDNSALLKAEYNIGSTMGASGDFDNAILAFGRMKKIGHELNNMRAVTIASSRLGLCYKKKKDYAKAISCFKEEKSVLGSEFDKVKADLNIGVCHFDMKKFGDALPFLEKYMVVAEEGDWPDRYNAYPTIGECFFHMKQYDKAIETLQKFLMFAETCGVVIEKEKMLMVWQILGDSYYDLKQYDDAIIFIEKLKSARIEMGKTNLVLQICEKLATCYKATQNYEKAMDQLTFVIEEQKKEAMCT
jgi:tetratricopeptide (TPR) repeat protein